ncbi:hydroxymethylglutaryl-CoA lyase [Pedobacter alpinus]|uniref:Hydroxymethylglutaryl-CoA lyase n=1 Tax=Pedobacter alpinus TaxID=1590643 RepID=A0ABW5TUK3_9SPHI
MNAPIKLIECPRDAMQGIEHFISTDLKANYINLLLNVGFDTIDFGSFVSPKAIPQMRDTAKVLNKLNINQNSSKLLAIVGNLRGAQDASAFEEIKYLGFPFSVSETFQQRNTNSSINDALKTLEQINNLCIKHDKEIVTYLSMGFGNPYGDDWNTEILHFWAKKISDLGVNIISLADTTGISTPENISTIFPDLTYEFKHVEWGMHLHATSTDADAKIKAAFTTNCKRFDSAIKGFGGCPMATNKLIGNIATEKVIEYLKENTPNNSLNYKAFNVAYTFSSQIFNS